MRSVVEVPRDTMTSKGRRGSARIVDGLSPVNGVIVHSEKIVSTRYHSHQEVNPTRIEAEAFHKPVGNPSKMFSMFHFHGPQSFL